MPSTQNKVSNASTVKLFFAISNAVGCSLNTEAIPRSTVNRLLWPERWKLLCLSVFLRPTQNNVYTLNSSNGLMTFHWVVVGLFHTATMRHSNKAATPVQNPYHKQTVKLTVCQSFLGFFALSLFCLLTTHSRSTTRISKKTLWGSSH